MSAKYAKNFKQMVGWWCQKEENKSKNLCKLHAAGTSSMEELQKQASLSESKEAAKSYCAVSRDIVPGLCACNHGPKALPVASHPSHRRDSRS